MVSPGHTPETIPTQRKRVSPDGSKSERRHEGRQNHVEDQERREGARDAQARDAQGLGHARGLDQHGAFERRSRSEARSEIFRFRTRVQIQNRHEGRQACDRQREREAQALPQAHRLWRPELSAHSMNDVYLQVDPTPASVIGAAVVACVLLALHWGALAWRHARARRQRRDMAQPLSEAEARILLALLGGEMLVRQLHHAIKRHGFRIRPPTFDDALARLLARKLIVRRVAILALDGRPDPHASYALTSEGYDVAGGIDLARCA